MNLKRYLLPLLLLATFLSTFILIQNSATETINEWTCRIDVTENNGHYDYVLFGENVNATDRADTDYDIPNPPQPPPPILDAYFYNADYPVPYDKLMQDIKRYTTENVKKEWLLKIYWQNDQAATVTLSWNNTSLQQTEYNYITLYDIEAENRINMLENSQYNFQISPGQTRQFKITAQTQDTEPPINPTGWNSTHTIQEWSNKNMISVTWWGATDDLSGIAGYSYTWNNKSDTIPDETIDTTEPTCTSPPLTTGSNWYLHIRTVDKAGNWNPNALHIGPFYIDTDKPTITEVVQDPPGQEIPEHENVTVIATITDKGSGILNATPLLQHKQRNNMDSSKHDKNNTQHLSSNNSRI